MSTSAPARRAQKDSVQGPSRPGAAGRAGRAGRAGADGGKRDQNRKRRIESLLDAALPLFLERGIEGVTIDDIVVATGIAKGSYYRYFDDKTALVRELLEPVEERVVSAFSACRRALAEAENPTALAGAYLPLAVELLAIIDTHPSVVRLYLQESRGPAVAARLPVAALASAVLDASVELTRVAHAKKLLRPMDPRISAAAVVGAAERLLALALAGTDLGPPEAVVGELLSLVLDGLRPRAPP